LQKRDELNHEAQRLRELGTRVEEKFLSGSAFHALFCIRVAVAVVPPVETAVRKQKR
jgi:hypothetical protein